MMNKRETIFVYRPPIYSGPFAQKVELSDEAKEFFKKTFTVVITNPTWLRNLRIPRKDRTKKFNFLVKHGKRRIIFKRSVLIK